MENKSEPGLRMKYFVLKPEGNNIFAEASRIAIRAYAKHIKTKNETLCRELLNWANEEVIKANKEN